jgi:hypothetical protein
MSVPRIVSEPMGAESTEKFERAAARERAPELQSDKSGGDEK